MRRLRAGGDSQACVCADLEARTTPRVTVCVYVCVRMRVSIYQQNYLSETRKWGHGKRPGADCGIGHVGRLPRTGIELKWDAAVPEICSLLEENEDEFGEGASEY